MSKLSIILTDLTNYWPNLSTASIYALAGMAGVDLDTLPAVPSIKCLGMIINSIIQQPTRQSAFIDMVLKFCPDIQTETQTLNTVQKSDEKTTATVQESDEKTTPAIADKIEQAISDPKLPPVCAFGQTSTTANVNQTIIYISAEALRILPKNGRGWTAPNGIEIYVRVIESHNDDPVRIGAKAISISRDAANKRIVIDNLYEQPNVIMSLETLCITLKHFADYAASQLVTLNSVALNNLLIYPTSYTANSMPALVGFNQMTTPVTQTKSIIYISKAAWRFVVKQKTEPKWRSAWKAPNGLVLCMHASFNWRFLTDKHSESGLNMIYFPTIVTDSVITLEKVREWRLRPEGEDGPFTFKALTEALIALSNAVRAVEQAANTATAAKLKGLTCI
jgi:hypothetical protein